MEDERRNGVAEEELLEEEEEEVVENGDAGGGLKVRSRKSRPLEKEAEVAEEHARSVYLDQEEGVKTLDETNKAGSEEVEQLITDKSMQNTHTDCLSQHAEDFSVIENHHHHKDLKVESKPTPEEEHERALIGTEIVSNCEQVTLPPESKVVAEMDLERILEEQDTHDLFCPNCHSCITKRVILRKRKRTSRDNLSDAKREKIEPVQADLVAGPSATDNIGESEDAEPDVFRCLSCLSFFIPTGTGFRLFKIFGKRDENENVQSSQQMQGRKQNWMFSFFELMKGKNKGSELEDPLLEEPRDRYRDKADSLPRKEKQITSGALISETVLLGKPRSDVKVEERHANKNNDAGSGILKHDKKDETKLLSTSPLLENVKDARIEHLDDEDNSQVSLKAEPKPSKEAHMDIGGKLANETRNEIGKDALSRGKEANRVSFLNPSWQLQEQLPPVIKNGAMLTEQLAMNSGGSIARQVEHVEQDSIKYVQIPANQEGFLFETNKNEKAEKLHVSEEGKGDKITFVSEGMTKHRQEIYLEGLSKIDSSLTTPVEPGLPVRDETQIDLGEPTVARPRQSRQWDVLKAIVYGGLLESIASLGVISSAAGSDVATLNVIALGLANLAGGLLVIIHNLGELKSEQYKIIENREEADRYWELLGTRGYFRLHAAVALISYIFVGILPAIVYGFSFRKSDNKEYKLIAVAVSSLLCIALLAVGKAHVQKGKPYVKTLLYYVGLGIGASGLSYAVGMLIQKLLEKLGLFDDIIVGPTHPFPSVLEVTPMTPSWKSY